MISIAMLFYTALITCCVGGLTGYHGKLACEGITTNEEIRGKFRNGHENPYDEGCTQNCKSFFYGGTSRVYCEGDYDVEALSKIEPNVFVIEPMKMNQDPESQSRSADKSDDR